MKFKAKKKTHKSGAIVISLNKPIETKEEDKQFIKEVNKEEGSDETKSKNK